MIAFGVKTCLFFKTIETPILPLRNVIVEGPLNGFLEMEPPGHLYMCCYVFVTCCYVFVT